MEEKAAEENEVVEKDGERKAERMGSEVMESSAHLADLAYPVSISPTYLAYLACPAPISLVPFIFFSSSTPHQSRLSFFFLSPISPKFFFCGCGLIFLAWVVVGFILVVMGWL